MFELGQLCSQVRDVPEDDNLTAANMKVELTKTYTFGISYFVPTPKDYRTRGVSELADSVVGVTKDGTGHAKHFRNVFKDTHDCMRVIQAKDSLFSFVPNGKEKEVRVHKHEKIDSPEQMKTTTLAPLS